MWLIVVATRLVFTCCRDNSMVYKEMMIINIIMERRYCNKCEYCKPITKFSKDKNGEYFKRCDKCNACSRNYNNGKCVKHDTPKRSECEQCKQEQRDRKKLKYEQCKQNNICVKCHKNPPTETAITCESCSREQYEQKKKYVENNRELYNKKNRDAAHKKRIELFNLEIHDNEKGKYFYINKMVHGINYRFQARYTLGDKDDALEKITKWRNEMFDKIKSTI